jgi:hypothetical protein
MILQRIGVVLLLALLVAFEAAIVSVMKDSANSTLGTIQQKKRLFHKWLIIWAAVNTAIIVVGWYVGTGTLLGVEL